MRNFMKEFLLPASTIAMNLGVWIGGPVYFLPAKSMARRKTDVKAASE